MQEKLSSQHLVSDLSFFHQKLPQRHIDLFHTTSQRVFDQMVSRVMTKIKRKPLQRYEFAIEVQKILASMKESHTRIWINHAAHSDEYAPILFQWLQDGYYIMAIQKEFYQYVGNKLIGIHDTPLKKIISLLEPLISAENDKSYTAEIPSLLTSGTLQKHLKIVPKNSKKILYKTENLFGQKQDISLEVYPYHNRPSMTSRSNQFVHNPFFRSRCPYCLERKLDKDALILYYSSCHDYEDDPLSNLYTELNKTLQSNPPRKIIIDLRNNQGGDSSLFRPMLKKLQSFKRKHPKTAFYVLVNESVFSSGIINAYDAKNSLKAKVIGTTPMQKPNHYGYVREIKLPNTKIVVQYSTKYFKFTDNDAEEFSPDHEVSLSVRDYLQGKDSVLEEALK